MARPNKSAEERLTERIKFDICPSDYAKALQAAEDSGMSLTAYARQQFLKGKVVIHQYRKLDFETMNELRKIGVNVNQLARIANQTGNIPDTRLSNICLRLEDILLKNINDSERNQKRNEL